MLLARVRHRAPDSLGTTGSPRREGRGGGRATLAESASERSTFSDDLLLKVLMHYNKIFKW